MNLTQAEREKLEDYQTMLGREAGSLALVLDNLTDLMAALGQHTVHCRVDRGPRAGEPPLDLVEVLNTLQKTKGLVQESLLRLRDEASP